ncbi:hypothetical protein HDR58_04100 [bacterium]|nr:hypothetical protein [bacterium]
MCNKLMLFLVCFLLAINSVYADCCSLEQDKKNVESGCQKSCPIEKDLDAPCEATRYQKFVKQVEYERLTAYNALNLSDEQIRAREEQLKANYPFYHAKFDCLMRESCKLKALKCANASEKDIFKQRQIVKYIKKDIEKFLEQENNEFSKCLTKDQRNKFREIRKLQAHDLKREKHKKDYYKANPQMRPFGVPCDKSCPVECSET